MPRKRFSPEEKAQIVIRGLSQDISIKELCNEVGIQPKSYYDWKQIFMQFGMEGFHKNNKKDNEKDALKKENKRLKSVVADLSLENHILKKNDD